jgi:hypothetical protein
MTVSLKHAFQSAKPDGADTSIVRPSDWNAEHVLTQATNKLLGRTSAGTGATEEIAAGSGLTLGSGTLSADVTSVAGRTGAVTLSVTDVSGAAPAASPTFTGKSSFPASTSTGANVNLGNGANVTSNLVDGDIWIETNNLRWYSNGVTWRASAVGHTHVSTAITDSTAAGRALLTGADASAQRTSLGLGSAALLNTSVIVQQDSATGSAYLPAGTTAQRPGTPAAGYIRYNSTTGKFEGFGSSWGNIGGGAAIGDTPPANPGAGDLWWNSADGRMYVYYTDANSSQWVDLSAGGAGQYLPLTGGTVTGNIEIAGTGRRITADFGNATFSNRFFFQSNAVNTQTALGVLPNGTSQQSQIYCWNNSDASAANAGVGLLASTTDARIQAQVANGGTALPLTFYTNSIERMRIDASGNVGIGASSPSSYGRLAVMTPTTGYGYFGIANSVGGGGGVQMAQYYGTAKISYIDTTLTNGTPGSETSYLAFGTANSGTLAERARIDNAGTFYVGGTSPSNAWFIASGAGAGMNSYRAITNGGIHHFLSNSGGTAALKSYVDANAGAFVQVSDANLKTDIEPARQYLNDLNRIQVVKYRWKTDQPDSSKLLGVIAQQVETVFPGLVKTYTYEDGREQKMVAMDVFVPMLLTAVQELNAKVDALQSELNAIKGGE